jgi:hypothetical protein
MELSLEQQEKLKRLDIQFNFLQQAIFQKSSIALIIASLSAAILIIATFGNNLLAFDTIYFKTAITILLSLIPISLIVFLFEIVDGIHGANKNIEEITGIDMKAEMKSINKSYSYIKKMRNKICIFFPYLGTSLLLLVIGYIILEIWK